MLAVMIKPISDPEDRSVKNKVYAVSLRTILYESYDRTHQFPDFSQFHQICKNNIEFFPKRWGLWYFPAGHIVAQEKRTLVMAFYDMDLKVLYKFYPSQEIAGCKINGLLFERSDCATMPSFPAINRIH